MFKVKKKILKAEETKEKKLKKIKANETRIKNLSNVLEKEDKELIRIQEENIKTNEQKKKEMEESTVALLNKTKEYRKKRVLNSK